MLFLNVKFILFIIQIRILVKGKPAEGMEVLDEFDKNCIILINPKQEELEQKVILFLCE